MDKLDIKVGYTCNNNCIHCVIKPNVMGMNKEGSKLDLTTEEVKANIEDALKMGVKDIVLTGGEMTMRDDFLELIQFLEDKVAEYGLCPCISLQTNGRELGRYVEFINGTTLDFNYVIALHSSKEELHNKIVGNKKDESNPYKETMFAIEEIQRVYGNFNDVARIELVISAYNIDDITSTVEDLADLGLFNIGISYPHLSGYENIFNMKYVEDTGTGYPHFLQEKMRVGENLVHKIGIPYTKIREIMPKLLQIAATRHEINLMLEEFPVCVFRDENGKFIGPSSNLFIMSHDTNQEMYVNYPDRIIEAKDTVRLYMEEHKKDKICKFCYLNMQCLGIWKESMNTFGTAGLQYVTKEEFHSQYKDLEAYFKELSDAE